MKALMTFSTSRLPKAVSDTILSTSWDLFTRTSRVNGCFNVESEPTKGGSSSTISWRGKESRAVERREPLRHKGFRVVDSTPRFFRKIPWIPLQDPCGTRKVA